MYLNVSFSFFGTTKKRGKEKSFSSPFSFLLPINYKFTFRFLTKTEEKVFLLYEFSHPHPQNHHFDLSPLFELLNSLRNAKIWPFSRFKPFFLLSINLILLYSFTFYLQIGSLKNYYLFHHRNIKKRSLDISDTHHSILNKEPEVRETTWVYIRPWTEIWVDFKENFEIFWWILITKIDIWRNFIKFLEIFLITIKLGNIICFQI